MPADFDAALAHDGLHHLHLGPPGGRFVGRTKDLLFAAFRDDDAYLVGVYPHGAWGRRELVERIVRNWPDAGLLTPLDGVIGLAGPQLTDNERWQLMKAGISQPIEIDGKVYASLGQTTAGTPLEVTLRVNNLMHQIRELREDGLDAKVEALGGDPSRYWAPRVVDEHVGLSSGEDLLVLGRVA